MIIDFLKMEIHLNLVSILCMYYGLLSPDYFHHQWGDSSCYYRHHYAFSWIYIGVIIFVGYLNLYEILFCSFFGFKGSRFICESNNRFITHFHYCKIPRDESFRCNTMVGRIDDYHILVIWRNNILLTRK